MDSGASVHITNNSANFDHATQSYGKEEVVVGNGEKMVVKHTDFTSLPCKKHNLKLNRVLHATQVTKNMISVSKLTSDNNIIVEFDSYECYVKDKSMWMTLLKRNMKDRLYEFQSSQTSDAHNRHSKTVPSVNAFFFWFLMMV